MNSILLVASFVLSISLATRNAWADEASLIKELSECKKASEAKNKCVDEFVERKKVEELEILGSSIGKTHLTPDNCGKLSKTHDSMKSSLDDLVKACELAEDQIKQCEKEIGSLPKEDKKQEALRELDSYKKEVDLAKAKFEYNLRRAEQLMAGVSASPNCREAGGGDPKRKPKGPTPKDPGLDGDPGNRNAGNPGSGQPGQDQQAGAGQPGGEKGGGQGGGGGGMPDLSSLMQKKEKEDKCKGMTGQALADCQRGAQTTAGSTGVDRPILQGASSTVIMSRQGAPATKATLKKSAAQVRADQAKAKLAAQHNRVVEQLTRTPASLDEQKKMSVRHGPHTDMFQAIKGRIREIRARDNL